MYRPIRPEEFARPEDRPGWTVADFPFQRRDEQAHEEGNLVGRATPVFGTESEQRHEFDALARAAFDRRPHGVNAARMPGHARQAPLRRPTAVAVHDDRDMARDSRDIGYANGRAGIGHGR